MARRETYEDISTILFLIPFVVSGGYALYLWVTTGLSATLPTDIYLTVTRDPYVFLIGSFSVMLGLILGVSGAEQNEREAAVRSLSLLLQKLAFASFLLSLLSAWYANGFTDLGGTALDFVFGKYAMVFPAVLLLLSYIVKVPLQVTSLRKKRIAGTVMMLLVPAVVYEVGKRSSAAGLGAGLVLLLLALIILISKGEKSETGQISDSKTP